MNHVMEIIFLSIPKIVFEPVMVLALLGGIYLLAAFWEKKTAVYWCILFSVAFMFLWRVCIQINSSRYAVILILPALFLNIFFFVPMSLYFPKKYRTVFFVGCIVVLFCVFIGKFARYNRFPNALKNACLTMDGDSRRFQSFDVYEFMNDAKRIRYYTGKDVKSIQVKEDCISAEILMGILQSQKRPAYLFLEEETAPAFSQESLKTIPGEWTLITSKYQDNRKKRCTSVYRFVPGNAE